MGAAALALIALAALAAHAPSLLCRFGLAFLLLAAVGLAMAARFPMDPVSTPPKPKPMSFSGKMHGVSFLIGVPCQILAVLLLSLSPRTQSAAGALLLLVVTSVIWLSLAIMITIMLMVGPGKPPNPDGPEKFPGLPNRLFMVAYGFWLMVAAWPITH